MDMALHHGRRRRMRAELRGPEEETPWIGLPGRFATALRLRSSFFDAVTDIGSLSAKIFLEAKLRRAASDQAASLLRSDGQSLEIALNPGEERNNRPPRYIPLNLNAIVRTCLEDDDVDPQVAERRVARVALVRRFQESSDLEIALLKRRKLADIKRYEAETRAQKEANIKVTRARKEANIEKRLLERQLERARIQLERARIQAEREEVEESAKAANEEGEWQRFHTSRLAAEMRREEIRAAAARGLISQEAANDMLSENRQTPIPSLKKWIGTHCGCETPSRCSSVLGKMFKAEVEAGRHVKPASHRNGDSRWNYYTEHDGPLLQRLHQQLEDNRKGVRPNQTRLSFTRES